jgi:hypothetical protein
MVTLLRAINAKEATSIFAFHFRVANPVRVAIVPGLALFLLLRLIALQYFRCRGARIVRCPETKGFAAVK